MGMNLILSTHNVTLTKAIEDHIISRINKLEHLNSFAINARVTLEHDQTKAPERQFSCSMRLSLPGPDLFAEELKRTSTPPLTWSPRRSSSKSASAITNTRPASTRWPPAPNAPAGIYPLTRVTSNSRSGMET